MSIVHLSSDLEREFKAEFGEDADRVAERALAIEITQNRVREAIKNGETPADALTRALASDRNMDRKLNELAKGPAPSSGTFEERLERWNS